MPKPLDKDNIEYLIWLYRMGYFRALRSISGVDKERIYQIGHAIDIARRLRQNIRFMKFTNGPD